MAVAPPRNAVPAGKRTSRAPRSASNAERRDRRPLRHGAEKSDDGPVAPQDLEARVRGLVRKHEELRAQRLLSLNGGA